MPASVGQPQIAGKRTARRSADIFGCRVGEEGPDGKTARDRGRAHVRRFLRESAGLAGYLQRRDLAPEDHGEGRNRAALAPDFDFRGSREREPVEEDDAAVGPVAARRHAVCLELAEQGVGEHGQRSRDEVRARRHVERRNAHRGGRRHVDLLRYGGELQDGEARCRQLPRFEVVAQKRAVRDVPRANRVRGELRRRHGLRLELHRPDAARGDGDHGRVARAAERDQQSDARDDESRRATSTDATNPLEPCHRRDPNRRRRQSPPAQLFVPFLEVCNYRLIVVSSADGATSDVVGGRIGLPHEAPSRPTASPHPWQVTGAAAQRPSLGNTKGSRMRFFGLIAVLAATASIAAASANTQVTHGQAGEPDVAVTHWSAIAAVPLTALAAAPAVIGMAMVHGAIYDAVNAIDGGHQPYLPQPHASPTASLDAAVATAAYDVLVGLPATIPPLTLPATLGGDYAASLALVPDGQAKTDGIAAGEAAAAAMLSARAHDGRYGAFRFSASTEVGQWRPEPSTQIGDPNAWLKDVTPFGIDDPAHYGSLGPDDLTSKKYADDLNEVKALGSKTGSTRPPAQYDVANFWAVNPP